MPRPFHGIPARVAVGFTSGDKVGDTFLVDGDGCLVPGQSPPRICVAAMWSLKPLVDPARERESWKSLLAELR